MWRICVVLLGVGLVASCASGSRVEQVPILLEDAADLRERMDELQDQVAELTAHQEVAACRLPNRVDRGRLSTGFPISPEQIPASGNVNVAVLFVDFPDAPESGAHLESFGHAATPGFERFEDDLRMAEDYLQAMSYGALDLTFRPHFKWLRMPATVAEIYSDFYSDSRTLKSGWGLNMTRVTLVRDAIELADPDFDFKGIDSVVVIATPKAESIKRGRTQTLPGGISYADDQTIRYGISMGSSNEDALPGWTGGFAANWEAGLIAHEVAHTLGLPDLYDVGVETDSEGNQPANEVHRFVGDFDIMGLPAIIWTVTGDVPSQMFAWSRWQLGWLRDTQIACITSFPASVQLTPLEMPGGIKAAVVPLTETIALVVESRRGALVYKVDTSVPSGEGPIVVGSPSRPPGLSALLDHGDVLSAGGYSVTVKEATSRGDFVEITGP